MFCYLQGCIHRIKENFNKEFEEVLRLKQAEIARIKEKNVRIYKIITQLQLGEEVAQPSLSSQEHPEELLSVQVRRTGPTTFELGGPLDPCYVCRVRIAAVNSVGIHCS